MFDYNDCEYIKNRFKIYKVKQKKRKILSIIFIIFLIIFSFITYLTKIVNPLVFNYASAQIEKLIAKSSNQAIESVTLNFQYNDIVDIKYDGENEVSSIIYNQMKINEIASKLIFLAQKEINSVAKQGINIPIGTCTGIAFLTGKGNDINFSINPIGDVVCSFNSDFKQAGINQTLHKVYINIKTEISLILPFGFRKIEKTTQFLLSECVIVGKIPDVYLSGKIA